MGNLGVRSIVFFEHGNETEMQMAPLAHHFLLIVAVVPAMKSMVSGQFFLGFCCVDSSRLTSGAKIPFK
jgi:hypothetical protein